MARRQNQGQKRVTLKDVAAKAGVSPATVSRALSGDPVAPETKELVFDAAAELGYLTPQTEKRMIGIVVPYLDHSPYSQLVSAIREAALTSSYFTLIGETDGNVEVEKRIVSEFNQFGITGLILVSPRMPVDHIEKLARSLQPIVTLNKPVGLDSPPTFGSVVVDNESGAHEAVTYLFREGHERIVYLAGRRLSASARQRQDGYIRAIRDQVGQHELRIIPMNDSKPDFHAGYQQCRRVLAESKVPDAILAYNDMMAIGALKALSEHSPRLNVPEDVSVIGFDNITLGEYTTPPLSTVGVSSQTMAWAAVDTLFSLIGVDVDRGSLQLHHVLRPQLIRRASVRSRRSRA